MLVRFYLAVGLALCVGLGTAFALGWKAPNLGFADGFSSGGNSRGGVGIRGYGYGSSGWSFGK
ncbi:hypothetical protein GC176_07090 [bacterium]|nr:hypothetical protein [bacterium]